MFEIHGLSPKKRKLSYNLWINQLHPEDKIRVLADIATVLDTTHNLDHKYRILKPSGELVYLETGAVVMCDVAGKPLRLIGLVKDVTNEKLVEQSIRDNEHKYRTLFETSDDAIILYTDRLWADCNKGAETLFEGNKEQLIGQDHLRFSPRLQPSGLPSAAKANAIFDLVLTGKPQFFEWLH